MAISPLTKLKGDISSLALRHSEWKNELCYMCCTKNVLLITEYSKTHQKFMTLTAYQNTDKTSRA